MMSESFDPNRYDGLEDKGLKLGLDSAESYEDGEVNPEIAVRQFQNPYSMSQLSNHSGPLSPSKESNNSVGGSNVCGNSYAGLASAQSKLDSLKTWGISTYKCTRQALQERLGKSTRTVDVELEQSIDALRDVQRRYVSVLTLARALAAHFSNVLSTQQQLGECFTEMAAKEVELRDEFTYNAETQKTIAKNGEILLSALNLFISSLATLCDKTIEDTILTIKVFEIARLEYDANRNDLEQLQQSQIRSSDFQHRLQESELHTQQQKQKYESLRDDVQVKMRFLHDNKVKVMQKQLLLFHNATSAFFSGNNSNLEAVMKQFSIKPKTPTSSSSQSWLEG